MTTVAHVAVISIEASPDLLGDDAVRWALDRLRHASRPLGAEVATEPQGGTTSLIVALSMSPTHSAGPESYRFDVDESGQPARATIDATDRRGVVYAVTELAERIAAAGSLNGLVPNGPESHAPAAPLRSTCRSFSSVHDDLAWFRSRSFWPEYLDHLAAQRFNRFHLALGMQYNFGFGATGPQIASDNYLCFAYPFLLDVPGFGVRVQGVSDEERDRNLAALRYIARETRRRGMEFQLGLWNHAYDYGKGSDHWYPILGIGRESHATYSAAAAAALLDAVPDITGLTFRVHYEGGIPDGHASFWDTMFGAISEVGRPVEVDLHAKGVDSAIIEAADKPNLRVVLSPKFAAEHMGLPYHQASIRPLEAPQPVREGYELMGTAEFSRRFTRYSYGDFLSDDRETDIMFRVWPGTQRVLLWGDPAMAAGFGRTCTIGGSRGLEICEPLYFKGRKGTGVPGGRDPYVDDDLRLGQDDWRKYRYTYLLWGRLLYDPDATPETWRRHLRAEYGAAADDVEVALATLSRVLPLVTSTHVPSASNNAYWPEVYTDLPISSTLHAPLYGFDTPPPTHWGTASPLDPTMFYGVDEYVDDALTGNLQGRYTPDEVAAWLDGLVDEGTAALERAQPLLDSADAQGRRAAIDLAVLAQLGRFFAAKFRAAVEYACYQRTDDPARLAAAIEIVETAHGAFARIPEITGGVYQRDIAFGDRPTERGHWSDRLGAMADDLRALRLEFERATGRARESDAHLARRSERWEVEDARLEAPETFRRGEPFEVRLRGPGASGLTGATLWYRPLDQSQSYRSVEMHAHDSELVGRVPGDETRTRLPIACFVEARRSGDHPILVPGLGRSLSNQPYVIVRGVDAPPAGSS